MPRLLDALKRIEDQPSLGLMRGAEVESEPIAAAGPASVVEESTVLEGASVVEGAHVAERAAPSIEEASAERTQESFPSAPPSPASPPPAALSPETPSSPDVRQAVMEPDPPGAVRVPEILPVREHHSQDEVENRASEPPLPHFPAEFDSPFKPLSSRSTAPSQVEASSSFDTSSEDEEAIRREQLAAPVSLRSIMEPPPSVPEEQATTRSMEEPVEIEESFDEPAAEKAELVENVDPPVVATVVEEETEKVVSAETETEVETEAKAESEMPSEQETVEPNSPEQVAVEDSTVEEVPLKQEVAEQKEIDESPSTQSAELTTEPLGAMAQQGGGEDDLLTVCDNLFARLPRTDRAIIAFASVSENDARATAIHDLATTMAGELEDPVLVIDGSPELEFSRAVDVRSAPRLDELAVGRFDWQELVVQTPTPGLCVLPLSAGPVSSEGAGGVTRLLDEITEQYRCVLVDLGSCESAPCNALMNGCDGAVLMIESRCSPAEAAISALRTLSAFRPPVLGSVLLNRRQAS